jgi:hypothetical protein
LPDHLTKNHPPKTSLINKITKLSYEHIWKKRSEIANLSRSNGIQWSSTPSITSNIALLKLNHFNFDSHILSIANNNFIFPNSSTV